jgi:cytochrome c5
MVATVMRARFGARSSWRVAVGGLVVAAATTACDLRRAMYDQPKCKNLRESAFFSDGASARVPPEGTVARDRLPADDLLHTGRINGEFADVFPFAVDAGVLERGRDRYDLFCSHCHDRAGTGWGMVVQRGYRRPPSYHIERLRAAKAGYFFDVIAKGFGVMPPHGDLAPPEDRWAIVAYVRALQLSQSATLRDVPEERRPDVLSPAAAAERGAPEAPP